jgi:LemA protein
MKITRRALLQAALVVSCALPLTGCSYNTFVKQEEAVKAQWAQVENQLQRRNDLIPNLVETVKGFAQHEESIYKDIAENYPNLKSNEQFNRLMDELAGTENRLSVERMRYNERVQEYNTARRQFPANLTAKMFGFKEYPFFQVPDAAKQVPKVDFKK